MILTALVKRETLHCWRVVGLLGVGVLARVDGVEAALVLELELLTESLGHVITHGGQLLQGLYVDVNDLQQALDAAEEHRDCFKHGVAPVVRIGMIHQWAVAHCGYTLYGVCFCF